MPRLLFFLLTLSLAQPAAAQVTDTTNTSAGQRSSAASVEAETRARDEAFAAWKVRYANNRAEVAQEIKAVRNELAGVDTTKSALKQQLTDLLNGSIRRWNTDKLDYGDPDQFADCQRLFATIRRAIQTGTL